MASSSGHALAPGRHLRARAPEDQRRGLFSLVAPGRIKLRRIDVWQKIAIMT